MLFEITNPGGMKPKYVFCSQRVIFSIFPHIRFRGVCRNDGMALLILNHDSGWIWSASCPGRFTPWKERTILIKWEGQFAPEPV
jgi:hypothetical protein